MRGFLLVDWRLTEKGRGVELGYKQKISINMPTTAWKTTPVFERAGPVFLGTQAGGGAGGGAGGTAGGSAGGSAGLARGRDLGKALHGVAVLVR